MSNEQWSSLGDCTLWAVLLYKTHSTPNTQELTCKLQLFVATFRHKVTVGTARLCCDLWGNDSFLYLQI